MSHDRCQIITAALVISLASSIASAQSPTEKLEHFGGKLTTAVVSVDLTDSRPSRSVDGMRAIVQELKRLPHLRTLSLSAFVNDDALRELAPMAQLEELHLLASQITDVGLKHLSSFQELRTLQLTRTRITDAGLKHIAELKRLRDLDISITSVTDEGLKELSPLTSLTRLDISHVAGVTDAGMKSVTKLEQLRTLWVYSTQVTDDGLKELASLEHLQELRIFRTEVTEAGVSDFKKQLPECKVEW